MNKLKQNINYIIDELGGSPYIQLSKIEALIICNWLKKFNPNIMLEIGTAFGGSAKIFRSALPECKIITVDLPPSINSKSLWIKKKEDLGKFLSNDIIQEIGDISECMPKLIEKYKPDIVFHDDGHGDEIIRLNIKQCYEGNIKNVIVHDSHKSWIRKFFSNNDYYNEIYYYKDIRGVSILGRKYG